MSDRRSGYAQKRSEAKKTAGSADGRALETRNAIVVAAREVFLEKGYAASRVEDILNRAGVSRPTFYRNFKDKFEVAKACHSLSRGEALEPWSAICGIDFRDQRVITMWLDALLKAIELKRDELAMWAEMSAVEAGYVFRMPRQMPALIETLGRSIPAFARAREQAPPGSMAGEVDGAGPIWIEAYLLLDQIAYQWSTIALGSQPISRQQSIDYFAARFLRFVQRYDDREDA